MLPDLPPPSAFGLHGYDRWREGQYEAWQAVMEWLLDSNAPKYMGLGLGTGAGKSLVAVLSQVVSKTRMVILTHTHGLQDQYVNQYPMVRSVMGMRNYRCKANPTVWANLGVCTVGEKCDLKVAGCWYFDAVREAEQATIAVTNYAFQYVHPFKADVIVCDEGHLIERAIESCTQLVLNDREWVVEEESWEEDLEVGIRTVTSEQEREHWLAYGMTAVPLETKRLIELREKLIRMRAIDLTSGEWVRERTENGWTLTPLWPAKMAERLWAETEKVLIMSATLTRKHMGLLGIEDYRWHEGGSTFPPENTPVQHVLTARLNHRSDATDNLMLCQRVDQVCRKHSGQRGVVFTVSYQRQQMVMAECAERARFVDHSSRDTAKAVSRWRETEDGVLVSPAVTTGWDLPEADFIVVCKLPYPDTRSEVMKQRGKEDKGYTSFLAMQTLVQETGRGTRKEADTCNVYILDDNVIWFIPRYAGYAPGWWMERVKKESLVTV